MSENKRRRVGIMGGTFDPIHIGHLILGEHAYHQFELDQVLFMPAGNPPHKRERKGRAATADRIRMVELAIADNPHFSLSLHEIDKDGYTYTDETLDELVRANSDTDYFFIMGADSLFQFEDWKGPAKICQLCTIIAAVRDCADEAALDEQILHLHKIFGGRFLKLNTPNIDISSHQIRNRIVLNQPVRYYIPEAVGDYVRQNELYKECEEHE